MLKELTSTQINALTPECLELLLKKSVTQDDIDRLKKICVTTISSAPNAKDLFNEFENMLRRFEDDNSAIRFASQNGHIEIVRFLLMYNRVCRSNPSADDNYAIRFASQNGHTEIVKFLLMDNRVGRSNPSAKDNEAIRFASLEGRVGVVKLLLMDKRIGRFAQVQMIIMLLKQQV
jgi:ankyrin repeat protein